MLDHHRHHHHHHFHHPGKEIIISNSQPQDAVAYIYQVAT